MVNNGPTGNSTLTKLVRPFAGLPRRSTAHHVQVAADSAVAARAHPVETGAAHQLAAVAGDNQHHRATTRGVVADLPDLGIRATTRLHRSKTPIIIQIPSRFPGGLQVNK